MSCYNIPCLTVKFLHIWTFRSCLNSAEADQTAEEDSDHGLYFLQFLHYVLGLYLLQFLHYVLYLVTSFRSMFYVYHHIMKHLQTNIILSIFSTYFVLNWATKILNLCFQINI